MAAGGALRSASSLCQAGAGHIFAQDVKHRQGVRRRLDALHVDLPQLCRVLQHLRELVLKKRRLLRGELEPGQLRNLGDIEIKRIRFNRISELGRVAATDRFERRSPTRPRASIANECVENNRISFLLELR